MLNVLDEFTRENLTIRAQRRLASTDVFEVLTKLFLLCRISSYIRSDNGPDFVAEAVWSWITAVGARPAFIASGSPWDEFLNGEIFYTLKEAQVLIEA